METSNPLPPPPRPGSMDSEIKGHGNLSNMDFRKMVLETPRRGQEKKEKNSYKSKPKRHEDAFRRVDTGGEGEEGEGDANNDSKEKKSFRKHRPPKPKTEEEMEGDENHPLRYRDRAKERRENKNPDYVDADITMTEANLNSNLNPNLNLNLTSLSAVPPPGTTDINTADSHFLTIKNSKFLGGDVKHTHLVKGLDFALRDKIISELEKKQVEETVEIKTKQTDSETSVIHHTALGKSIYNHLFKNKAIIKTNDMFLPGRTAYHFNMDENINEIPTTVYRSKADCPVYEETVSVSVDSAVLDRISKIISYLRLGKSGKVLRKKKKEKEKVLMQALVPEKTFLEATESKQQKKEKHEKIEKNDVSSPKRNPEEDIFQDAGVDYDPENDKNEENDKKVDLLNLEKDVRDLEDMEQSPEGERGTKKDKFEILGSKSKYFGDDLSAVEDLKTIPIQYGDNNNESKQNYTSSEAYVQNYPIPPPPPPPPPEPEFQTYPPPPPPPPEHFTNLDTNSQNFTNPDMAAANYAFADSGTQSYQTDYAQPSLPEPSAYTNTDWQTYLPGMENSTFYQTEPTVYTEQQYFIPQIESNMNANVHDGVSNPLPPVPNSLPSEYLSYVNPSLPLPLPPAQPYDPAYSFAAGEVVVDGKEVGEKEKEKYYGRREVDPREKDPTFISSSYAECYPDYDNFSREVVGSDEEADLTKMDMGGKSKGRMHRWDFQDEEEWEKYNEKKEAMPKAAFQFGIKMVDGRKTRKMGKEKDQKITNELQKINQILERKRNEKTGFYDGEEENHSSKRPRN